MSNFFEKALHNIADSFVKQQEIASKCPLGKKTELRCSCGGFLHEFNPQRYAILKSIGKPRYSKNKRIQKKFKKQWRLKNLPILMTLPLVRGGYKCGSCGRRESLYGAIGRNLFKVQEMPQGAVPYYNFSESNNKK